MVESLLVGVSMLKLAEFKGHEAESADGTALDAKEVGAEVDRLSNRAVEVLILEPWTLLEAFVSLAVLPWRSATAGKGIWLVTDPESGREVLERLALSGELASKAPVAKGSLLLRLLGPGTSALGALGKDKVSLAMLVPEGLVPGELSVTLLTEDELMLKALMPSGLVLGVLGLGKPSAQSLEVVDPGGLSLLLSMAVVSLPTVVNWSVLGAVVPGMLRLEG